MNTEQRRITLAALSLLLLSLAFAPWEETGRSGNALETVAERYGPILKPPQIADGIRMRLRTEILLCEWIALGLFYAGALVIFKDSATVKKSS